MNASPLLPLTLQRDLSADDRRDGGDDRAAADRRRAGCRRAGGCRCARRASCRWSASCTMRLASVWLEAQDRCRSSSAMSAG